MADSYNISQKLGMKIIDLIGDELDNDEYFACGIAALEMAKSLILQLPALAKEMGRDDDMPSV